MDILTMNQNVFGSHLKLQEEVTLLSKLLIVN